MNIDLAMSHVSGSRMEYLFDRLIGIPFSLSRFGIENYVSSMSIKLHRDNCSQIN